MLPEISPDIWHITSYLSNDEIIDQFNAYVRGPLRENVLESMGKEGEMPFKLYCVAILPWLWISMVKILGCDGRADCDTFASYAGFPSVWQYTTASIIFWGGLAPMVFMTEFQLMLFSCKWAQLRVSEHPLLRILLGSSRCAVMSDGVPWRRVFVRSTWNLSRDRGRCMSRIGSQGPLDLSSLTFRCCGGSF